MGRFVIYNKETGDEAMRTDSRGEVKAFFASRIAALVSAGLERGRALSKVNSVYEVFGAA